MIVAIALSIDQEIDRLSKGVGGINARLKECFADKTYGNDIESLFIGLILTAPGSERLHPVRAFKYRRKYTLQNSLTGTSEYLGSNRRGASSDGTNMVGAERREKLFFNRAFPVIWSPG